MRMTLNARARRNAARKNNKVRCQLPLLAATETLLSRWLTTPEKEKEHLLYHEMLFHQWQKEYENTKCQRQEKAAQIRATLLEKEPEIVPVLDEIRAYLPDAPVYALGLFSGYIEGRKSVLRWVETHIEGYGFQLKGD